jgi:iron complex outermembrane receptor protein
LNNQKTSTANDVRAVWVPFVTSSSESAEAAWRLRHGFGPSSADKAWFRAIIACMPTSCRSLIFALLLCFSPSLSHAQAAPQVTLPIVTVTAQKEAADPQTLPVSVSAVPDPWLEASRITWTSDAVFFSPNTVFTEFSARKLSNPRVRGVGASPSNPAITTYLDGVPLLHANAASVELNGVSQLEFVRGPQSALFGRNTLGGLINVLSERPSLSGWRGEVAAPFGNFGAFDLRGSVSGPITDRLAIGVSAGHSEREGFTVNPVTGNDLDSRSANFAKAQVLFTPSQRWQTRVLVSGEDAEDGDYALNDLAEVRRAPFQAMRDFEGFTNRDVFNTTIVNRYESTRLSVTATTGFVNWNTEDQTDLDYTPLPLARRSNLEEAFQFTQEVRVASAPSHTLSLGDSTTLRWQAGLTLFTHDYNQNAVNSLAPSPFVPIAVQQTSPRAALDDAGVGLYGQGTMTFEEDLAVTIGGRFDHESKDALLEMFFAPAIAPPTTVDASEGFSDFSPQVAVSFRLHPGRMLYASLARGFKAGGFNPASPIGNEAYGEEHTLNFEGGVKTSLAGGRVTANAAVFFTDWSDLQLNVPNPQVPAQFYVANVGSASNAGIELEVLARPVSGLDVFSTLGFSHARFGDGTTSSGVDVSGRKLPFTPDLTFSVGAQATHPITSQVSLFGRGELMSYSGFQYDEANTASQDAYAVVNFRAGARARLLFAELWMRNAFDTRYIPVALPYPGFTTSGFLGEPGHPRMFGLSVGVTF